MMRTSLIKTLLRLSLLAWGVHAQPRQGLLEADGVGEAECHNACNALLNELGEIVKYGLPPADMRQWSKDYFSTYQAEVVPACMILPTTPTQVSQAIILIRQYTCPFAIKSGGHAPGAGISSSPGGITIDLRFFKQLEYLGERDWDGTPSGEGKEGWRGRVTRLGPGLRWSEVYEVLEKEGMTVVGGRASAVGVGGFILGGGISFNSHEQGWAADNVRNFELVLPNGTITNVNHASNPELFSALRGGGNNFGIVTRFDVETYPQASYWAGYNFWFPSHAEIASRRAKLGVLTESAFMIKNLLSLKALGQSVGNGLLKVASKVGYTADTIDFLKAFESAVHFEDTDHHSSHIFMSYAYVNQLDTYLMGGQLVNTKGTPWPEVFQPFKRLNKPLWSNSRIVNITALSREVDAMNPAEKRHAWMVQTLRTTPLSGFPEISLHELLNQVVDIFTQEVESIKEITEIVPSVTFQVISRNELKHFEKNGGNAIGLKESDGPLIILSMTVSFETVESTFKEDDVAVRKMRDNVHSRSMQAAKNAGMHHPYQYMNYADAATDVFAGYGKEQRTWLRKVQKSLLGNGGWDAGGFRV